MLNKHNFAIAKLCAKEPSRFTLQGIRIEPDRTVVTDGRCLVSVTTPKTNPENFPVIDGVTPTRAFEPFTLDRDSALAIGKAIPKSRSLPILEHAAIGEASNANGHAQIFVTDLERPQVFQPRKLEGQFPDYARVIAGTEKQPAVKVAFNGELLLSVFQQAAAFVKGQANPSVVFSIFDSENAARLDCRNDEGQEFTAVIMPWRLS